MCKYKYWHTHNQGTSLKTTCVYVWCHSHSCAINSSISKSLKSCQKWLYLSTKPIDLSPLIRVDPFHKHPDPFTPSITAVTEYAIATTAMANTTAPIHTCLDRYKGEVCGMLANREGLSASPLWSWSFSSGRREIFDKIPSNSKWICLLPGAKHANPPLRSMMLGPNMAKTFEFSDSHATHQQAAMLPSLEAPVAQAHLCHLQCGNLHILLSINSIY